MEDLLFCKNLHDPIEKNSAKPCDKTLQEWENINKKIVKLIEQWIKDSIFYHVVM